MLTTKILGKVYEQLFQTLHTTIRRTALSEGRETREVSPKIAQTPGAREAASKDHHVCMNMKGLEFREIEMTGIGRTNIQILDNCVIRK